MFADLDLVEQGHGNLNAGRSIGTLDADFEGRHFDGAELVVQVEDVAGVASCRIRDVVVELGDHHGVSWGGGRGKEVEKSGTESHEHVHGCLSVWVETEEIIA